ncbi:hypothetical protein [Leptospira sp. GIMC2001]|uniref:hypothetical protein n=1 Tax=Leptospira sp. GIMC2001 TaxID=1513297 RepID=UPI0023492CF7|nr:hypothetical protein [Leptospira sp. GIMC2001]WCL49010.1 hypothetical protein O4O04_17215 [Leptospira sp. GIMC2001]
MKKFIIALLIIFSSTHCILFNENDLDPNSELSLLLQLSRLFGTSSPDIQSFGYLLEVTPKQNGSAIPNAYIQVHKVSEDAEIPTSISDQFEFESFIGTFLQNPDNQTKIYLEDLGTYRFDIYEFLDPDTFLLASYIGTLSEESSGLNLTMLGNFPTEFTWDSNSLSKIPKRNYDSYQFIYEGTVEFLGSVNGTNYSHIRICFNKDLKMGIGSLSLKAYPMIISTKNGIEFSTKVIYDFSIDAVLSATPTFSSFDLHNYTVAGNEIVLMYELIENGNAESYKLVRIPADDLQNLVVSTIAPRGIGNTQINGGLFYYFGGKIIYLEEDNTSQPQVRTDSNFFDPASVNEELTDWNGPFSPFQNGAISKRFFLGNSLVGLSNASCTPTGGYFILNSDLSFATPESYTNITPLGGSPSCDWIAHPNQILLYEQDSVGTAVRISTTSDSIPNTLTFTNAISYSTSYTTNLSPGGFRYNTTKTIFEYERDESGVLIEFSNTDNSFRNLNYPASPTVIPGLTTGSFSFSQNCDFINDRIFCFDKPQYSDPIDETNFRTNDLTFSYSDDGINWTNWEPVVLEPARQN